MKWYTRYPDPWKKYAAFRGRACRAEYWTFALFNFLIVLGLARVDTALFGPSDSLASGGPITAVFSLAALVPSLAVGVRRLHDTDRSGWWMLVSLIPILGGLALLVFFVSEGDQAENRFGPDPLNTVSWESITATSPE